MELHDHFYSKFLAIKSFKFYSSRQTSIRTLIIRMRSKSLKCIFFSISNTIYRVGEVFRWKCTNIKLYSVFILIFSRLRKNFWILGSQASAKVINQLFLRPCCCCSFSSALLILNSKEGQQQGQLLYVTIHFLPPLLKLKKRMNCTPTLRTLVICRVFENSKKKVSCEFSS